MLWTQTTVCGKYSHPSHFGSICWLLCTLTAQPSKKVKRIMGWKVRLLWGLLPVPSLNKTVLLYRTSLVAQRVKRLLAMQETWVWFLGQEDPLEKEIATHSSTPVLLPGKSHGWKSLVGYNPQGRKESDTTEWLHFLLSFCIRLNLFLIMPSVMPPYHVQWSWEFKWVTMSRVETQEGFPSPDTF